MRIKRTGFIEEEYETESGDVDADDNTFNSLVVDSNGFYIDNSFDRFYKMVLENWRVAKHKLVKKNEINKF